MAGKDVTKHLYIKINDKEIKNSLGSLGRRIGELKGKIREANDPKVIKEHKAELEKTQKAYGNLSEEIYGTNDALQEASTSWDTLKSGFLSGDLQAMQAGVKGIAGNIKGMTKAALSFIATPLGAALTAVTAIGFGVKKWAEYNLEIAKTNELVTSLTQETGDSVDYIRIRAEELKKTFDVDLNESITTAKSLVEGFEISYEEAFDIIEDGAIRGKLKNDEYLDSLKEYPVQFENAGFSAQDFANIVSTGIDMSIYSDKLPDAIKEFTLSVTEQTQAAKDALTNAFGEEFTKKLLKGLEDGSITAKDALATISAEAERIGLNSQQAQLLTADLFKGAGEDAGGALKIFKAVNTALNEQKKPLTELQQIQKEQLEANKELNSVYTQLFASGSEGFSAWIEKGKLFGTKILLKILKGGVDLYNWFVDLNNESRFFSAIITGLGKSATIPFSILGDLLNGLWNQIKAIGTTLKGVFTLDWEEFTKGISMSVKNVGSTVGNMKDTIIEDVGDIYDAFQGRNKMEHFTLSDFVADEAESIDASLDQTIKKVQKFRGQVMEKMTSNGFKFDESLITEEQKEQVKERLDEVNRKFQELNDQKNKLAGNTDGEEQDLSQLDGVDLFGQSADQWVTLFTSLDTTATKAEQTSQKLSQIGAVLGGLGEAWNLYSQFVSQNERKQLLSIEKSNKAKERSLKSQLERGIIDQETYNKEVEKLDNRLAKKQAEIQYKQAKRERTAAILGIVANTAAGIAKSVAASPLTGGMPWAAIIGAIGAAQTALVLSEPLPDKGFYEGGPTGNQALYKDEHGGVTGVVHEDEWVGPRFMTQDPKYAPTFAYLERERQKGLGKFFNGGPTTQTEAPEFTEDGQTDTSAESYEASLLAAITQFNKNVSAGIRTYMVRDYQNFLDQKEIDEEHEEILNNTTS